MKRRQFLLTSAPAVVAFHDGPQPCSYTRDPFKEWLAQNMKCTSPPTISGTASEGETLVFTPGEWEMEDDR